MSKQAKKNKEFECAFCEKTFVKESSLAAHSCARKMRWLDKDNINSVVGFMTFQRFYQLTGMGRRSVTFEKFIQSSLYNEFLRYAHWLNSGGIVNPTQYTDYLIKGNFKIRNWTKSSTYEGYLRSYLFNENPIDGIERSLVWITRYCDENNISVADFFEKANTNIIVDVLRNGKLSPWIFIVCDNATKLYDRFDQTQHKLLGNLLDYKVWALKVKKHKKDVQDCKTMIESMAL